MTVQTSFTAFSPTTLLFGPGRLADLATVALPGTKALLLTSNGTAMERTGTLARVRELLARRELPYFHLAVVEPNPLASTVMTVAETMKREGCDFLIVLGGGSVRDCAKATGIVFANGGHIWDYVQQGKGGRKPITVTPAPVVAITTTAGTGSEVDAGGVITNPETTEKVGVGYPNCIPKVAIVEPELMMSAPAHLTALQGFDALFHAVEGYVTKRPNWMSDMYALESVRHIAAGLARAVKNGDDIDARSHVALANTFSGYVMTLTRLTSQHAMEHAMSAFHQKLPHGAGLIMLSVAYFTHLINTGVYPDRFVTLAKALGHVEAVNPHDFIKALVELQRACGVDSLKMSDYGITENELQQLAHKAREAGAAAFEQDAVALTFEDTLAIYRAAFK